MKTGAVSVTVYRNHMVDSTNGGVTAMENHFVLYSSRAAYTADPHKRPETSLIVATRELGDRAPYVYCVPAESPKGLIGPMAGGNFVFTSDSRFHEVTESCSPISVHDRFETQEMNDLLSI